MRPEELTGLFAAPAWLRDLGVMSWLVVGAVAVIVGVVWLIDLTAQITIPVILGCVVGAVAGPLVDRLAVRGVPRGLAAAIVMLLIVAAGIGVLLLTLGGLATQAASISDAMTKALDEVDGWLKQRRRQGRQSQAGAAAVRPADRRGAHQRGRDGRQGDSRRS